jgi:hypothetical protein
MAETVSSRPEAGGPLRIWDVERLRELAKSLPAKWVPLSSLTDLDRVGWHGQGSNHGRLTLREVAEHARRIQEATFDHPVILSAEGHLLDGFHRVAKAYLLGMTEIAAVQFEVDPAPDRIRPLPEWLAKTL